MYDTTYYILFEFKNQALFSLFSIRFKMLSVKRNAAFIFMYVCWCINVKLT